MRDTVADSRLAALVTLLLSAVVRRTAGHHAFDRLKLEDRLLALAAEGSRAEDGERMGAHETPVRAILFGGP